MDPLIKSRLLCRLMRKRVASTSSGPLSLMRNRGFFIRPPVEVRFSSMRRCPDVLSIIGLLNVLIHT